MLLSTTHAWRYSNPLSTREIVVLDRRHVDDLHAAYVQRDKPLPMPKYHRPTAVPTRPFKTLTCNYQVRLAGALEKKFAVQSSNSIFAYCPVAGITDVQAAIVELYIRDDVPISCLQFLNDVYLMVAYVLPNGSGVADIIDVFINRRVRSIDLRSPILQITNHNNKAAVVCADGSVALIDVSLSTSCVWQVACHATRVATNHVGSYLVASTRHGVYMLCWNTGRRLALLSTVPDALLAFDATNANTLAVASGCDIYLITIEPNVDKIRWHVVGTAVAPSPVLDVLFAGGEILTTHRCAQWSPARTVAEWHARPHYVDVDNDEMPSQVPTENVVRLWKWTRHKLVVSGHLYFDNPLINIVAIADRILVAAEASGVISLWALWPPKKTKISKPLTQFALVR